MNVSAPSLRVCVADDNFESAELLCEGLRLNQYEAVAAHTGTHALQICQDEKIDLVLLDICMPEMDGLEVCRRLKENPRTRDIVVIFVTVRGSKQDIHLGYALGAADYITKPYNLPMVMVRVEAAINSRRKSMGVDSDPSSLTDDLYTDGLTGLRNRAYLLHRLQEEVDKGRRYGYPVSCVAFDIDEMTALDEELGQASLDDLLGELAMTLRNHSRTHDILARYDGTVLTAILPHCNTESAIAYAHKIVQDVDVTTFSEPCFPTLTHLRVGIATVSGSGSAVPEELLGEAMHSLFQARSRGKDRIIARQLVAI